MSTGTQPPPTDRARDAADNATHAASQARWHATRGDLTEARWFARQAAEQADIADIAADQDAEANDNAQIARGAADDAAATIANAT